MPKHSPVRKPLFPDPEKEPSPFEEKPFLPEVVPEHVPAEEPAE